MNDAATHPKGFKKRKIEEIEFNFVYVVHCAVSKISSWRHGLKKIEIKIDI